LLICVKLATLQLALARPPPVTDAETHFRATAVAGTVMQPLNFDDIATADRFQLRPVPPGVRLHVIVAADPLTISLPGLLAVNGIVLGVACIMLTTLIPMRLGGTTTEGWCPPPDCFWAHANPPPRINP
jgi:hypothetical protein